MPLLANQNFPEKLFLASALADIWHTSLLNKNEYKWIKDLTQEVRKINKASQGKVEDRK